MRLLVLIGFILTQCPGMAQTITWGGRLQPQSNETTVALQRTADGGFVALSIRQPADTFYLTSYAPDLTQTRRISLYALRPIFVPQDFLILDDGNIIFTGAVWLYGRQVPPSIGMMRIDSSGRRWAFRPLGGRGADFPGGILPLPDGNYIVFGSSASDAEICKGEVSRGGLDYWWLTLDTSFRVQKDKTLGGAGADRMTGILAEGANQWVWGESDSPKSGDKHFANNGGTDGWLVKTDERGEPVWQVSLGSAAEDHIASVCDGDDGDKRFFVSNVSTENPAQSALTVYRLSADGIIRSTTRIDMPGLDRLGNVLRTPDDGFIMTMTMRDDTLPRQGEGRAPQRDIRVIRLDHQLQSVWQTTWPAEGDESNPRLHRMSEQSYLLTVDSDSFHSADKSPETLSRQTGICWLRVYDDSLPRAFIGNDATYRQLVGQDPTRFAFPVNFEDTTHD